jgi:hypothetical protein
MLWVATVALAVLSGGLLLVLGWDRLRRPDARLARTADLLLSLRVDRGLAVLEQERQRSDVWWADAPPLTRRQIDATLSTWDLVASLARAGRVDQRVVLEHFGAQVLDLWELAYPYVQHRHEQQPRLWESLGDLYLDAFETTPRAEVVAPPAAPAAEDPPSAEPAPAPEPADPSAADQVAETAVSAEVAPAPVPAEPVETHQALIAALRDLPRGLTRPPAPRTALSPATSAIADDVQRQPAAFEEVVDLVRQPPTRRE